MYSIILSRSEKGRTEKMRDYNSSGCFKKNPKILAQKNAKLKKYYVISNQIFILEENYWARLWE